MMFMPCQGRSSHPHSLKVYEKPDNEWRSRKTMTESSILSDESDTRPRVMAIFAHPDDAEFICSGTIARFVADGYRAHYVLATSGDKGSDDYTATREQL